MNYFSSNLKFLLKTFNVTQDELALQTEKKRSSISNWINDISMPNVADLIAIRQFFGISIDALITEDLKNGKVITDEHVQEFQRKSKVLSKVHGKVKTVSRSYFAGEDRPESVVNDSDKTLSWAVMGQLRLMDGKLDELRGAAEKLLQKGPK